MHTSVDVHLPNPYHSLFFHFQERTHACSSAPSPGRRSAVAWESSRSSSHWAATASYYNSPPQLVHTRTHTYLLKLSRILVWPLLYYSPKYLLLEYRNLRQYDKYFPLFWRGGIQSVLCTNVFKRVRSFYNYRM